MIILKNIYKKYKHNLVLNNFNLEINEGNTYLFIGFNGSGKSTILNIISENILKFKGRFINNLTKFYLPEKLVLPKNMNSFYFLEQMSKLYNSKIVWDLAYKYKLENKKIGSLSKGNLQKIGIITMILSDSDLILLDEPLEGLDDTNIKLFINDLKSLKDLGKTILISTHNPKEYKKLIPIEIKMEDFK